MQDLDNIQKRVVIKLTTNTLKDKTWSKSKVLAHKLGKYQTRQQNYTSKSTV